MKINKCYPPRLRKCGIKIRSLNTTSFQSKGKRVYSQVSRQTTVSSKCSSSSSTGGWGDLALKKQNQPNIIKATCIFKKLKQHFWTLFLLITERCPAPILFTCYTCFPQCIQSILGHGLRGVSLLPSSSHQAFAPFYHLLQQKQWFIYIILNFS